MKTMLSLEDRMNAVIREVPDFPKKGILFKDITPIFQQPALCRDITIAFCERSASLNIQAVVGIESRGFLFGMLIAQQLQVPFVPVRKAGKLPYSKHSCSYELEYGTATVEMHTDALRPGSSVLIHDDLLATGGTAAAAAQLVEMQGAKVAGFSFLIELDFLQGRSTLQSFCNHFISIVHAA